MGWNRAFLRQAARVTQRVSLVAALTAAAVMAQGQTLSNNYLTLGLGTGGLITLSTPVTNPTAPKSQILTDPATFTGTTSATYVPGSHIYIRVDSGNTSGGADYIFGGANGGYLATPTLTNNQLSARWATSTRVDATTGLTRNDQIEVDMNASFVHNAVRFQFTIRNTGNTTHQVALGFLEDLAVSSSPGTTSGPLRLPNQPYLRVDTLLTGASIPQRFEVFSGSAAATGTTQATYQSVRGTLRPTATSTTEPTPPTRFIYGKITDIGAGVVTGNFDRAFNYQVRDTTTHTDTATNASDRNAVLLIWDAQSVAPSSGNVTSVAPIITYVGQADNDIDVGTTTALTVSAPIALSSLRTNGTTGARVAQPNPFTINAYVTNNLNLLNSNQDNGPFTLYLDLPLGLKLATGETNPKTLSSVPAGAEGNVAWSVVPDGTVSGSLLFTVKADAQSGFGDSGKVVQRSIVVPGTPIARLKGGTQSQGRYQMISLPVQTGTTAPSQIFFPNQNPNLVAPDLAVWNPVTSRYDAVTAFTPGFAYWIRNRVADPVSVPLSDTFNAVDNQTAASSSYNVSYPVGWNQIGNPYLYSLRASEIRVFDITNRRILTLDEASQPQNGLIAPIAYRYNTDDPDAANWALQRYDNLGFDLVPLEGYWIDVLRDNLQFSYTGVDTPGAAVTRQALGTKKVQPSYRPTRRSTENWRMQLVARSKSGNDPNTYIGVTPKASDNADWYKFSKPPAMNQAVSLDLMEPTTKGITRVAESLKSGTPGRKTWNLQLTAKPNEDVTLSWPDFAANVPRGYRLTLIDTTGNTTVNLRNAASRQINMGSSGTRSLQIVAEPTNGQTALRIMQMTVVPTSTRAAGGVGSVNIQYGLSGAADTLRATVRSSNGQVLRALQTNAATRAAGGSDSGSLIWDLRDERGRPVPAGVYNIELVAVGPDGQTVRRILPYTSVR